eukprot:scaffold107847_cov81-Phaeocystis_antarctica.AAC.1
MTSMEQLLSETLAEFEFDEPVTAKVPGSMCVWRSLMETAVEETAEKETAVEETAEEEIDWNSEASRAKDTADAAERLKMLPMPQFALDNCGCAI